MPAPPPPASACEAREELPRGLADGHTEAPFAVDRRLALADSGETEPEPAA